MQTQGTRMNTATLNLAWADAFIAALTAAGLRHIVLAPGARSAPLAVAALRRPELTCHVVSDERAAGYFALGLVRGMAPTSRMPAAVICTSGTAVANLMPAVMEANLAAIPLLILSADRPPEAHGWGSHQTADQLKLYGDHARRFFALPVPFVGAEEALDHRYLNGLAAQLIEASQTPVPGPVHANQPFREPLLPIDPGAIPSAPNLPVPVTIRAPIPQAASGLEGVAERLSGRTGLILCGEGDYPETFAAALVALAEKLGAPILAEPLSNLRFGPHDRRLVLTRASRFLRRTDLPQPEWVLRLGRFPVSRTLERWLAGLEHTLHILIAPPGPWPDPLRRSDILLRGDALATVTALHAAPTASAPAGWLSTWQAQEIDAAQHTDLCHDGHAFAQAVSTLIAALPAKAHLFVGNSLSIRAVDSFSGTHAKPLTLHGNRGAAGIDGNLATAAGIAAAHGAPMAVLIGDQTALHDCGSLALLAGRPVVVIVVDNGGGGIFEQLAFSAALPPEILTRGFIAPPQVDFSALARAFGLSYAEADDVPRLQPLLDQAFTSRQPWLIRLALKSSA